MQQPSIIRQIHALAEDRALEKTFALGESQLGELLQKVGDRPFERIYVLGSGTSYYAAQVCKYVFEEITAIPTEGMQAFAFAAYQSPALLNKRTLVVGFSTSGGTEAVVNAFAKSRGRGAFTLAVTAMPESDVARAADAILLTGAEDEVGLPRTKAQSQGLVALYLLAIHLGRQLGRVPSKRTEELLRQLGRTTQAVAALMDGVERDVERLAQAYRDCEAVFVLGSGPNAGTAQTGALMITEMAKIHTLGDELENFLHGRFREVDQSNPLIILAPKGASSSRALDFLTVTDHVEAQTVVLTDETSEGIQWLATQVVRLPGGIPELFTPILYITPLHMFGYYLAVAKGVDPIRRRYPDIVASKAKYKG